KQPVETMQAAPLAVIHFGLSPAQISSLEGIARGFAEGEAGSESAAKAETAQLLEWRAAGPAYDVEVRRTGDRKLRLRIIGPGAKDEGSAAAVVQMQVAPVESAAANP